jgi:hypothetical protein
MPIKHLLFWLLNILVIAISAADQSPKDVIVDVHKVGDKFEVKASYLVPMDLCNAFAFITDYEDARNIKGIAESKIISRTDNKVIVERKAKETVLLFPLEINTTLEYTEMPNRGLNFEQIHGDNKTYKGTWRLEPQGSSTKFVYQSVIEVNSMVPKTVLEYFMKNTIKKRFEAMAARATLKAHAPTTLSALKLMVQSLPIAVTAREGL